MRKMAILSLGIALCALSFGSEARAQKDAGAIEIMVDDRDGARYVKVLAL